jgi:hypothetical protein
MKGLTLIFLLCAALLLAACGGSSNQANSGGNAGGENKGGTNAGGTTKTETKTETKGSDTSTAGAVTGIAACDEYIAKVEKCVNSPKWPEQVRTTYKQNLEQYRAAWKQAASTPEGKATLESQCKTVLQAAAAALDACQ